MSKIKIIKTVLITLGRERWNARMNGYEMFLPKRKLLLGVCKSLGVPIRLSPLKD